MSISTIASAAALAVPPILKPAQATKAERVNYDNARGSPAQVDTQAGVKNPSLNILV